MSKGPALKPDADAISDYIETLRRAPWLGSYQRWWPRFVFHSSDVENIAAALNHGTLLSRNGAKNQGLLVKDCGSPAIISGLRDEDKDWVRLYFRPMTPTQFSNEGIRPIAKIEYRAHVPVPVYLVFRSKDVLGLRSTCFTTGRFTRHSKRGDDVEFLRSIPFKKVFHEGRFARKDRDEIVDARHAEVLVKDSLSLDHLQAIGCRAEPERETLFHLLEPAVLKRWRKQIVLERPDRQLFNKRGTFVESVDLSPTHSNFTFYSNIPQDYRGPFHVRAEWHGACKGEWEWEKEGYVVGTQRLKFTLREPLPHYTVRLEFNGDLAYQSTFVAPTVPEILR